MDTPERQAAEAMYRALSNRMCDCVWNVPYHGMKIERVVTKQCGRCRAMVMWEAAKLEQVT